MPKPARRRRAALAAVPLAAVLVLAAGCGGGSSDETTTTAAAPAATGSSGGAALAGTVGPGYTISLTRDGQPVETLQPGTYEITVDDESSIHNFTLEQESGGDFEQDLTDISDTGTKTVKVTLGAGEWKFYCSAHESQMNGSFTVS